MNAKASFADALCQGYERLSAWADLLDRINVFPVADADTGTNLKISLAPLRLPAPRRDILIHQLMSAATGNSGNIAAAFLCELIKAEAPVDLKMLVTSGSAKARQAVSDPQPGTILTVMEAFDSAIHDNHWKSGIPDCPLLIRQLEKAVADTADMLPVLKAAGVIDAGALGMFVFLEAYLSALFAPSLEIRPVTDIFPDKLMISADWQPRRGPDDVCVNTMIQTAGDTTQVQKELAAHGDSLVVGAGSGYVKVHMHTQDPAQMRERLSAMGRVAEWSQESISTQVQTKPNRGQVHIMTDAAGSVTSQDARDLGVTLLNSYLVVGGRSWPETAYNPQDLYEAMGSGAKVTTAQASLFERRQSYLSATRLFDKVLYLSVGSVYTGNYHAASTWQTDQGCRDRFVVLDTGAASGRLGVIALATARLAQNGLPAEEVIQHAHWAVSQSREWIFLDQLKYLAAGGRISKTKGFFGDLMGVKPIVSPRPEGAVKVGVARSRDDQMAFALDQLGRRTDDTARAMILVQYADNRQWVEQTAAAEIKERFPGAEVLIRPLSLTSGAHMGPGTWAVAFLPALTPSHSNPREP
jgi:DegV family protein with EDD domain